MPLGRMLILAGLGLIAAGVIVTLLAKLPLPIGRLPGDIRIEGKHGSFYFPIATCLLISVLLTLVMWIFRR